LVQAQELTDLPVILDELANLLDESVYTRLPRPVAFANTTASTPDRLLERFRIAVARDAAFSFLYRANLDCLAAMGAELVFFSPLGDEPVPPTDAVYLPGGYPELHAGRLAGNSSWLTSMRAFAETNRPVLAECGGMMVLFDTLTTRDGAEYQMAGLLPGKVMMGQRLAAIGLQSLALPEGELRGHTFHFSRLETPLDPVSRGIPYRYGAGEYVYRQGAITASYLHAYFPSNPGAVAALLRG
jgi:cobyrinic acid a,c-diamide synthase